MNSYLDLVKEYAEKHKRKNRMSLFVILLAVALVARFSAWRIWSCRHSRSQ